MGVKGLWPALEPVRERTALADLGRQAVAIDLSIWIVEANSLTQLQHVTKPHLRHVFFRVVHLLDLGITPVVVIEGIPPDLKQAVMQGRLRGGAWRGREGGVRGAAPSKDGNVGKKVTRARFSAVHRECCVMLDALGVPWLQSEGEAEAMCAQLNLLGYVDGCITNDGDVFLYGARVVYRNFTINNKDPHVDRYKMAAVEARLGLGRENLVGLALLRGCDYLPRGVKGVGGSSALRLINSLPPGTTLLDRFCAWASGEAVCGVERQVAAKVLAAPQFPFTEIISEFLISRDKCPKLTSRWKRPSIFHFMNYAKATMEWPFDYAFSKILPLVSLFDMTCAIGRADATDGDGLRPRGVLKARVKRGVACFEIRWHKPEDCPEMAPELYVTLETQSRFSAAFPLLTKQFLTGVEEKRNTKKQRKKVIEPQISSRLHSASSLDPVVEHFSSLHLDDELPSLSTDHSLDSLSSRLNNLCLDTLTNHRARRMPLAGQGAQRRRSSSVGGVAMTSRHAIVSKNCDQKHLGKYHALPVVSSDSDSDVGSSLRPRMKVDDALHAGDQFADISDSDDDFSLTPRGDGIVKGKEMATSLCDSDDCSNVDLSCESSLVVEFKKNVEESSKYKKMSSCVGGLAKFEPLTADCVRDKADGSGWTNRRDESNQDLFDDTSSSSSDDLIDEYLPLRDRLAAQQSSSHTSSAALSELKDLTSTRTAKTRACENLNSWSLSDAHKQVAASNSVYSDIPIAFWLATQPLIAAQVREMSSDVQSENQYEREFKGECQIASKDQFEEKRGKQTDDFGISKSLHTPPRRESVTDHERDELSLLCLTPWSNRNIGRFTIETSLLDDGLVTQAEPEAGTTAKDNLTPGPSPRIPSLAERLRRNLGILHSENGVVDSAAVLSSLLI